jgi:tetratricopeptide (TPR) repeat protein
VLLLMVTALAGACAGAGTAPSDDAEAAYVTAMEVLLTQDIGAAQTLLDGAEAAFESDSDRALLMVGRSRLLSARGAHEEALQLLQQATELAPELAEAHYFLSLAYFNGFLNEESLAAAARAVELEPDHADYLYQAAQMYQRGGRMEEAEATWEKLLEVAPDDARYLVPLAGLHNDLGNTGRALEILDRAAAVDPESQMGQMARQLAVQLRNQEQTSSELQRIDTALKFSPQNAALHRRRADLLLQARDYVAAEGAVRNAMAIEPEVADNAALLSRILDAKEDKPGALAAMQQAVALDPQHIDNTLSLAGLYMQAGDLEQARAHLEKVIEMAPDSDQATFAREQLLRLQGGQ